VLSENILKDEFKGLSKEEMRDLEDDIKGRGDEDPLFKKIGTSIKLS
jgi:hypothetical protein